MTNELVVENRVAHDHLHVLESIVIHSLRQVQQSKVAIVQALMEIRDSGLWLSDWPQPKTFEEYLDSFVQRVRDGYPDVAISRPTLQESMRFWKRLVLGSGADANSVLNAPVRMLRKLEGMAHFDNDGKVTAIAGGLNEDAMPQSAREGEPQDRFDALVDTTLSVLQDAGPGEAVGFVKSVRNEPEITFLRGVRREVSVRVLLHRPEQPALAVYKWNERWPDCALNEYLRRLRVRVTG